MSATTLTLHETKDPEKAMFFALDGDYFTMDLSDMFKPKEPASDAPPPDPMAGRMDAMVAKIVQPFSGPTHVKDVTFLVEGDKLTIQIWKRTRGLRLAPMVATMNGIDDPQAAAIFAAQLKERSLAASHPGKYSGALDYWGSWALMVLGAVTGVAVATYYLSRSRKNRQAA
ncbi:MAG: hypothetical protein JW726_06350 [Anaerolineales bacterium]|nr:hypothetical protein [Anaerolineales bacterium]